MRNKQELVSAPCGALRIRLMSSQMSLRTPIVQNELTGNHQVTILRNQKIGYRSQFVQTALHATMWLPKPLVAIFFSIWFNSLELITVNTFPLLEFTKKKKLCKCDENMKIRRLESTIKISICEKMLM